MYCATVFRDEPPSLFAEQSFKTSVALNIGLEITENLFCGLCCIAIEVKNYEFQSSFYQKKTPGYQD